jgi:hypothetical protein
MADRPREVTVAGLLLLLLPLLSVVSLVAAVVALLAAQDTANHLADELRGQGYLDADKTVQSVMSGLWLQVGSGTVIKVIQAVALGVLAFFVLRGSSGARIGVYVVAGLTVVGAVCTGVLTGLLSGLRGRLDSMAADAGLTIVTERDVLPGWYQPINYVVLGVSLVMVAAVVWLLTRPAANAYFASRKVPRPGGGTPPPGPVPA